MKRTRGLERVIRARAPWKRNFSGGGSKMQLDSLCRGGAKVLQDPGRMCWGLMEPGRREELQWRRSHCGFISPGDQPALRLVLLAVIRSGFGASGHP